MRNVLAGGPKAQQSMVTTTYIQAKPEDAHQQLRKVADCLRPKFDKAAEVMGL
jgi:hypothetical protein